ncbi:hypothetical protein QCA50_011862 [Cerrena zonata]|uniref:F-box domain-containing protein n=1 Tax=Cerrena zonata TaxID=2478898 RepID=A0AAW0FXV8_9APHY
MEELWNRTTGEGSWTNTLCACALVCSRWWAAARPFIFRYVIIRNSEHIHQLARQIHHEPNIALWIRKLRFEGKSNPRRRFLFSTPQSTVKEDLDAWMYTFFSVIRSHLCNVKTLEIFGFKHLSQRREDYEAYARWILHLSTLDSVESLHLARCELPPNATTALIRAFSKLCKVSLTCVSFRGSNGAELAEMASMSGPSHLEGSPPVNLKGSVKYPVLYSPPRLTSFSVDNDLSAYIVLRLELLKDWLCPRRLASSLQYLHLGGCLDWGTVAEFIAALGPSPAFHTLRICVEITEEERASCRFDISGLTNLKHFILDCPRTHLNAGIMECICQLFTQVEITDLDETTLRLVRTKGLDCVMALDRFLCGEEFRKLKQLNVSIADYSAEVQSWYVVKKAKELFQNMETKGISRVVDAMKAQMP